VSNRQNWLRAQVAEKKYHRVSGKQLSSEPSQYLNNYFHLSPSFFYGQKVLEVGVAVWSTIHNVDGATLKVGLDPLARYFSEAYPRSAEHIQGRGEELPFLSRSFDTIVCLNTLDHTENPLFVLREIRRCLKAGGTLLISVDTFTLPKILRRKLLAKADIMHPHHFGEREVLEILHELGFVIKRYFYQDSDLVSIERKMKNIIWDKRLGSALKYFFAKVFAGLRETWIVCK
jgi:SAM-dependent methyltransferase